jgi:hypothetical protein
MTGCLRSRAGTDASSGQASKARPRRVSAAREPCSKRHLPSFARLDRRGRLSLRDLSLRDLSLREAWLRQNAGNAAFGGLHALGQGGEEHPCVRRDDKQDE